MRAYAQYQEIKVPIVHTIHAGSSTYQRRAFSSYNDKVFLRNLRSVVENFFLALAIGHMVNVGNFEFLAAK